MIYFESNINIDTQIPENGIFFHPADQRKVLMWLERAANTLSPPDPELIQILDEMKSVQR